MLVLRMLAALAERTEVERQPQPLEQRVALALASASVFASAIGFHVNRAACAHAGLCLWGKGGDAPCAAVRLLSSRSTCTSTLCFLANFVTLTC